MFGGLITDWSLSGNHIFSFIGVIVYIAIIAFKWYCDGGRRR